MNKVALWSAPPGARGMHIAVHFQFAIVTFPELLQLFHSNNFYIKIRNQ